MILVTGESGQLGNAFKELLPDALYPTEQEWDLTASDEIIPTLVGMEPEAIINCAAYTAVDRAEEQEDLANAINAVAVGLMARYAAERSIPFVTYSTDYVFPGTGAIPYLESSLTDPINAYGRSKRKGEILALEHPGSLVIRTSWLISGTNPNFVATMLRLARSRDSLQVVDDQVGCPTVAADLAAGTLRALDIGATGILHLTNQGPTTWYQLARQAVELAGGDAAVIAPCTTADYPVPTPRPAYSVLGSERVDPLGIDPLPAWRESLPAVVEQLVALGVA
ncbi:MAG: dTDP-4-dehydrorhamnose reductase [Acidimicrobiia bacterium]|nr:dTDP-4-dehydrorhamnose reductase [Acidimicrobiia bacterium]